MMINKLLLPALLSLLLTGCRLLGDYTPSDEIAQAARKDGGICFQIEEPGDYYVYYLTIRDRSAPEMSGFNRLRPALTINDNHICIPESDYTFPYSGAIRVEIDLHSPSRVKKRRYIVSEFKMVNGEPHPFSPREYLTPAPGLENSHSRHSG